MIGPDGVINGDRSAIDKDHTYLYQHGQDPNNSLESVGVAYRSNCVPQIDCICQVVEGIHAILFNMVAFHVPGRSNGLRNDSAAKSLVNIVRCTTERVMNDVIKLSDLTGQVLNRSLPFTEMTDFTGLINHLDGDECAVSDCSSRAEYCTNPLNPLDGFHCSEQSNAPRSNMPKFQI